MTPKTRLQARASATPTPPPPAGSDFNLRALVREVLTSSTMADPGDIAEEVYRRIAPKQRPEALQQALRHFVRQVITETRMGGHTAPPSATSPPNRSAKVTGIREGWQKCLRDRAEPTRRSGEPMRRCGPDSWRRSLAAASRSAYEQSARNFHAAAPTCTLMTEHDVQRFGDLPAEVLMSTLGAAA